MGFHLVDRAIQFATLFELSDRERLVLIGMAHRARDEPRGQEPAGVYAHGWDYLACAWLGYPTYDDAAHKAVQRAIARLNALHGIKTLGTTGVGRPAQYELQLDAALGQQGWWLNGGQGSVP